MCAPASSGRRRTVNAYGPASPALRTVACTQDTPGICPITATEGSVVVVSATPAVSSPGAANSRPVDQPSRVVGPIADGSGSTLSVICSPTITSSGPVTPTGSDGGPATTTSAVSLAT